MRIKRSRETDSGDITFNSDIIPTLDQVYDLGDNTHDWKQVHTLKLVAHFITRDLDPFTDNNINIGDSTHNLQSIFVNAIEGGAKIQILIHSLLGGL